MKLHLGPFQGITDVWYRQAFQQWFQGIDVYYTPFFGGIHGANSKHFRSDELNPILNQDIHLIPQLLTNNPEELELFAQQCSQLGYSEININMGCPWPQVTSKKRGCGLMPYPAMVASLLKAVPKLPIKVSVKCRLGMHDSSELATLIPIFETAGISQLIVHARTGVQRYKGFAQPEILAELVEKCRIPIIYNGDIFSPDTIAGINRLMPQAAGLMLGRGLLANPFLAADIQGQAVGLNNQQRAARVSKFVEHLTLRRIERQKRAKTVPGPMKELWSYLSRSFEQPVGVWRIIRKANDLDSFFEAQAYVFRHFEWTGNGFDVQTDLNPKKL